jgi:hypothetical protein
MTTAYIIERFERKFSDLRFETGFYAIVMDKSGEPAIRRGEWIAISPYTWLTMMSVAISIVWSRRFLLGIRPGEVSLVLLGLYLGCLVLGHALICYGLYLQSARHIPYFVVRWRRHIACYESTNTERQDA